MRKKKAKSAWAAILMALICLGVAAYFCGKIYYQQMQYKKGDDIYEHIADLAVDEKKDPGNEKPGETEGDEEDKNEWKRAVDIDFSELKKVNPEVTAWLYCPDTVINYPVCQGEDNTYYLRHLVDRTYNLNGCLFVDCDNKSDFADHNTIIYGHHMASGKMFATLIKYADQEYFKEHPVMYLETKDKEYKVELFSGYTTEIGSGAYMMTLADDHTYAQWLREIYRKSDFDADVILTTEDHIITLSTCAYSFQDARYVLHGKLTEMNNDTETTNGGD